jgi:HK97 family phage major capsid protein
MPQNWTSDVIEIKATLTETTAGGTTGSGLPQPQVTPGILSILFQQLTIEDLIPGGATNAALVRYLKETVATNAAAAVAEGAAKPASTLNFAAVDEPVRKIATTIKVTDEMFQDVPQIQSYINNRLMLFVRIATEAALLTGAGAPSLTGFLNRSGLTAAQAIGTDTAPDAIYKEITKIRIGSFLEPDGIVVNPNNWQTIRLSKDANNQYYGGGPFTAAYGNPGGMAGDMLWGKRVVVTTAMTAGTALIGAFATASQIFNNGGLTVEATNSNEDDFLNNLIAIRAERRLALAVYRPAAFGTVTGLT